MKNLILMQKKRQNHLGATSITPQLQNHHHHHHHHHSRHHPQRVRLASNVLNAAGVNGNSSISALDAIVTSSLTNMAANHMLLHSPRHAHDKHDTNSLKCDSAISYTKYAQPPPPHANTTTPSTNTNTSSNEPSISYSHLLRYRELENETPAAAAATLHSAIVNQVPAATMTTVVTASAVAAAAAGNTTTSPHLTVVADSHVNSFSSLKVDGQRLERPAHEKLLMLNIQESSHHNNHHHHHHHHHHNHPQQQQQQQHESNKSNAETLASTSNHFAARYAEYMMMSGGIGETRKEASSALGGSGGGEPEKRSNNGVLGIDQTLNCQAIVKPMNLIHKYVHENLELMKFPPIQKTLPIASTRLAYAHQRKKSFRKSNAVFAHLINASKLTLDLDDLILNKLNYIQAINIISHDNNNNNNNNNTNTNNSNSNNSKKTNVQVDAMSTVTAASANATFAGSPCFESGKIGMHASIKGEPTTVDMARSHNKGVQKTLF